MDAREAARLIGPAVRAGGTWADLGAGRGTFTAALCELLGARGEVYAVERDHALIASLERIARRLTGSGRAPVIVVEADFTKELDLPPLNGILLANALHFVPDGDQATLLRRLGGKLVEGGHIVVVEYDDRPPSRWVPYPASFVRLGELARNAQLGQLMEIGRTGSAFGGTMYAAEVVPVDRNH